MLGDYMRETQDCSSRHVCSSACRSVQFLGSWSLPQWPRGGSEAFSLPGRDFRTIRRIHFTSSDVPFPSCARHKIAYDTSSYASSHYFILMIRESLSHQSIPVPGRFAPKIPARMSDGTRDAHRAARWHARRHRCGMRGCVPIFPLDLARGRQVTRHMSFEKVVLKSSLQS